MVQGVPRGRKMSRTMDLWQFFLDRRIFQFWLCAAFAGVWVGVLLAALFYFLFYLNDYQFRGTFPPPTVPLCHRPGCTYMSDAFTIAINASASPCHNFFDYVCSKYSDPIPRTLLRLQADMWSTVKAIAYSTNISQERQTPTQKAAAMFRACVRLKRERVNEMQDLKDFMRGVGVEIAVDQDNSDNTLEKVVQLGLEYNIPTLLTVTADESVLWRQKPALLISQNEQDGEWYETRRSLPAAVTFRVYSAFIRAYGAEEYNDEIARTILAAEDIADETRTKALVKEKEQISAYVKIKDIGTYTPTIPSTRWTELIEKYTDGAYKAGDVAAVFVPALCFLDELHGTLKPASLKLLIAWDLLRTLGRDVHSTLALVFPAADTREKYCAAKVSSAMPVVLYAPFLFQAVTDRDIRAATDVLRGVRDAYVDAFERSPWISGSAKETALRKLKAMSFHVGYPEGLENEMGLDTFYEGYPVVGKFFASWIAASKLTQKKKLASPQSFVFRVNEVNAFYARLRNTIVLLAPILRPPVLVSDGPASINFGALGQVVGHEVMHGYDVTGSMIDDQGWQRDWWSGSARDHYVTHALCLRASYRRARHGVEELNDTLDSENLADFSGLIIASRAYRMADSSGETRLPGLPFGPSQLFFLAHCYKWCAAKGIGAASPRYATNMARCNVPLMNMKEFAQAFGCKQGDVMNPKHKCSFW
ncbi:neprilysin-11-like isoform X2 [Ornithodoros turicata]|uniref:neprilysin-11-like isoform X2 n=1 Tax=Ornithodoros turicata TaxID=34597 RepID=UPI00313863EF